MDNALWLVGLIVVAAVLYGWLTRRDRDED